jgi:hypothetical protein
MRLYRLTIRDEKDAWFGTKSEYNRAYRDARLQQLPITNETGKCGMVEVPTDKGGLLHFLNTGEPPGEPPE